MAISVRFVSNVSSVKAAIAAKCANMANAIANDLLARSFAKTPKKSGDLRAKRQKVIKSQGEIDVKWTSDHAAVQEAGKRRGARAFSRYTTAGTGAHFVANKVKDIKANISRYWK